MKKFFTLALVLSMVAMFAASCSKEKEDTNTLVGTTWKCYHTQYEGISIQFVSETVAYILRWEYEQGEYIEGVEEIMNYVFNAPNGVLYSSGKSISFTIDGNYLTLIVPADGETETMIFIKQ